MNLIGYILNQREWSRETFGPGDRLAGITAHIEKELAEVRASGGKDIYEWCDVIILALDGAWRAGHTPEQIAQALLDKHAKNRARVWPDWRTAGPGPIEHVRDMQELPPPKRRVRRKQEA